MGNKGSRTRRQCGDRNYSRIARKCNSLLEVTAALAQAGLQSSNLIVGIDFTKSNKWTGASSFHQQSLHHVGSSFGANPYERAISIIGQILSAFDDDNLIPCYGFGDESTRDRDVFSFYPDDRFCNGYKELLTRYREIVPQLRLAGPKSFAPIIEMAMKIVEQSGGQHHVLLIIADGPATRSVDMQNGHLSPQEQMTVDAIVRASEFPLSIVLVGVGDGPWDMMRGFEDKVPARAFDNFQFVNFTEIMNGYTWTKQMVLALPALMEIPSQYKATLELGLLGRRRKDAPERIPIPPPDYVTPPVSSLMTNGGYTSTMSTPTSSYQNENRVCPICFANPKDMAFGCGHQTCCECGDVLKLCPFCRSSIHTRIKLY
ncbi:uncharacterized protein J3R85_002774 [Psidium guajava]|nr:uncharacterized protein J3R85_002774 [Psidium guajava]